MRTLYLALCCSLFVACESESVPPPVAPAASEVSDPFVLDLIEEHLSAAQASPADAKLRSQLGLIYEANHIWMLAARAFANAAALNPESPEYRYHAALAFYNVGYSAEGDELIENLATRFPRFAPGLYRHGVLLVQRGEIAAAQIQFNLCGQFAPNFPEVHVAEAETWVLLDDAKRALELTDRAFEIQPGYARAHYIRGLALQSLGRSAEAAEALKLGTGSERQLLPDALSSEIGQYATGVSVIVAYANQLLATGNAPQAMRVIEAGLLKRQGDLLLRVSQGIIYRRLKQPERAVAVLVRLHEDEPNQSKCLTVLAGAYFDLSDLENSLLAADKAARLIPDNGRVHLLRGRALVGLKRMEEAGLALEKAILLDPDLPTAYIHLAESLAARGRYTEAEAMWKNAVERLPKYVPGWLNLGMTQIRLLKVPEARATLAGLRALGINHPSSRDAQGQLAKALFDLTGE